MKPENALKREEWMVVDAPLASAQEMVRREHYSGGGSNTAVAVHGLVRRDEPLSLRGIAWWLPPTRVAAESVHDDWKRVLSLTRLVVDPDVPTNGASFLMAASIRKITETGNWSALVTYADESQGHIGAIYRATNWDYVGRTGPYPRWLDPFGRQVAPKATTNRTKAEMEALGHRKVGSFYKHKFVMVLPQRCGSTEGQLFA
jgi:hypothetical protein